MSPRFTFVSLITKLNRPFEFPLHLISVCNFGNSADNLSKNVLNDKASHKMACQKLSTIQVVKTPVSIAGMPITANVNYRIQINPVSLCKRDKHTKSKKTSQEDDEDEEDLYMDSKDDESHSGKIASVYVASLRVDIVLKAGLGFSRSKVEELFYQSRVRVNDEKILKKSNPVTVGDYIDIVRGINSNSDRYIDVMRLHIVGIRLPKEPQSKLELKVKRDKLVTIENYKNEWQGENM